MITGLVTIAGGIGLMMTIGSGAVAALKWFNTYDVDFSSKKKSEGSSGYAHNDAYKQRMSAMKNKDGNGVNVR